MFKRVVTLSALSLLLLPLTACSSGGDDGLTFGSFSTTAQATFTTLPMEEEDSGGEGDGDGDTGDGDGDPTGDGDGDPPGDGDGDNTSCPVGQFGCPCDMGTCEAGLACIDGECALDPGGDGDPDPTTSTTGNGADPYDPATCMMPSIPVTITGVTGDLCSPPCTVDADCPASVPGSQALCVLALDGMMDSTNCALICQIGNNATCPAGATCKDLMGTGICTYP